MKAEEAAKKAGEAAEKKAAEAEAAEKETERNKISIDLWKKGQTLKSKNIKNIPELLRNINIDEESEEILKNLDNSDDIDYNDNEKFKKVVTDIIKNGDPILLQLLSPLRGDEHLPFLKGIVESIVNDTDYKKYCDLKSKENALSDRLIKLGIPENTIQELLEDSGIEKEGETPIGLDQQVVNNKLSGFGKSMDNHKSKINDVYKLLTDTIL